ncbi:MAG: hypothetical protein ABIR24_03500 [Verrucomicrobiota bacterium]
MFAKVFQQILDSSVATDYLVRLVFEDFLKLSDSDGIVDITPDAISRRTNVPLEIVLSGISELEGPDKTSRTPDNEGRRIIRLDAHRDWGWRIVNFHKYRQSATKEMLRMSEAERKSEWRRRKGFAPKHPSPTPPTLGKSTEEEAEQSRTSPGHVPDKPTAKSGFKKKQLEDIWEAYPLKKSKPDGLKAIGRALEKKSFDELLALTKQFATARNGDTAFCPNPSTWFNQERYNDDPETWKTANAVGKPIVRTNGNF